MALILKENDWAQEAIVSRSLGNKPTETLTLIARHYLESGYKKSNVRSMLDTFLLQCDPDASLPGWSKALDRVVIQASKRASLNIDSIDITRGELGIIDSMKGVQVRRLAFTLLCLAKYRAAVNPLSNGWVRDEGNEIMSTANINTSIRRQSAMYKHLGDIGFIQFARAVGNTSVRVLIAEDGPVVMRITDMRNLGYQYLKHHGGDFFDCTNCGITAKIDEPGRGARQKYCRSCAIEVATQQRVNSVMRRKL